MINNKIVVIREVLHSTETTKTYTFRRSKRYSPPQRISSKTYQIQEFHSIGLTIRDNFHTDIVMLSFDPDRKTDQKGQVHI